MDPIKIITLVLLLIISISSGYLVYLRVKKNNNGEFSIEEYLQDFLEDILKMAQSAVKILNIDRDKFENDAEFEEAVMAIVAEDIRRFLKEDINAPIKILNILTEDAITDFLTTVFTYYRKEIYSVLGENDKEEEDDDAVEETEDISDDNSTMDISGSLNGYYEE